MLWLQPYNLDGVLYLYVYLALRIFNKSSNIHIYCVLNFGCNQIFNVIMLYPLVEMKT